MFRLPSRAERKRLDSMRASPLRGEDNTLWDYQVQTPPRAQRKTT